MQPNLWSLSGDQLHILYMAPDVDGRPSLSYRDAQQSLRFAGDDLRVVDTDDLATLVSVTVRETADTGSMTFTLVVPRVTGAVTGWAEVSTVGITTAHRAAPVTALRHGQVESYSVTAVTGTVRTVQTLDR